MASTISKIPEFRRLMRRKIIAGLEAAAATHAQLYADRVNQHETKPPGTHKRKGEIDQGVVVERSEKGEYPYRDSGDGLRSIRFAVKRSTMEARSGVLESGMHLVHLSHGSHPKTGEKFERLGMEHVLADFRDEIRRAFIQAAKAQG